MSRKIILLPAIQIILFCVTYATQHRPTLIILQSLGGNLESVSTNISVTRQITNTTLIKLGTPILMPHSIMGLFW